MKRNLTQAVIRTLPTLDSDLYDTECEGLVLRTRATGRHTWRANLGRGRWLTLGSADSLPPAKARDLARAARVAVAGGDDPIAEKRRKRAATLDAFLDEQYGAWAEAHLKTGDETATRVRAIFADFLKKPMPEITPFAVERWRTQRHRAGITPSTTNRDLDCLRSVLSKAVQWGALAEHPMRTVTRAKVDTLGRLRYLSPAEEQQLRAALDARDQRERDARARFNTWRRERGYTTLPDYGTYTDHLQPVVLLALNTGLRRGELLARTWGDVDLVSALLTVRGVSAKSGRTRYLPLNSEAIAVLKAWQPSETTAADWVFPGPTGERMRSLKTAWGKVAKAAGLKNFTFHDLRHSFASKLVQMGVDLNTVRELLGHSDIKMTLRYAHLAPEHRAAAVAKLVRA